MPRSGAPDPERFRAAFDRSARPIRARLAVRRALAGAAIGLLAGTVAAGVAWKTRHAVLRPWAAGLGVAGAAAGLVIARRRRWSDDAMALYLDANVGSREAISAAIEP